MQNNRGGKGGEVGRKEIDVLINKLKNKTILFEQLSVLVCVCVCVLGVEKFLHVFFLFSSSE